MYTALVQNGYRNLAYQWFNERKDFYHPIAAKKIRAIIFSSMLPHEIEELQNTSSRAEEEKAFLQ